MRRFVLTLLVLCGCGSTTIDVRMLSHACSVDAECVAVYQGDACQPCHCADTAIAASAQSAYDLDAKAASSGCGPAALCFAQCPARPVQCAQGLCALK